MMNRNPINLKDYKIIKGEEEEEEVTHDFQHNKGIRNISTKVLIKMNNKEFKSLMVIKRII